MMKRYSTVNGAVEQIDQPCEGSWIALINPTDDEISTVSSENDVDTDTLRSALDMDERSRIETDESYTMVLVNIPTVEEHNEKELYNTIPLSVIITKNTVVTVCLEDTPILKLLADGRVKDFRTNMKSRFVLQVLYRTASAYLQYLRIIDKKSESVENKLHKSTQNRELIELLKLEKSLVYFTTALRSNEMVLEKLFKNDNIKRYPEDTDLLEDVIVENKQAIEMANIYSGILSGMMDAFASVISNNLNIVMKVLAIITIVMSIPTMIFSAYGMNVAMEGMPIAGNPNSFTIIVIISLVLSLIVTLIFVKLKMFK
ncbi:MAG: magnesium transporter CorA family protein [Clostridia bacterium]